MLSWSDSSIGSAFLGPPVNLGRAINAYVLTIENERSCRVLSRPQVQHLLSRAAYLRINMYGGVTFLISNSFRDRFAGFPVTKREGVKIAEDFMEKFSRVMLSPVKQPAGGDMHQRSVLRGYPYRLADSLRLLHKTIAYRGQ